MKHLIFDNKKIIFDSPSYVNFASSFDQKMYDLVYAHITDGESYSPIIDSDSLHEGSYGVDVVKIYTESGLKLPQKPSIKASNKKRLFTQFIIRDFLSRFPEFMGLFQNNVSLANVSISNAELLLGSKVDGSNFIHIKSIIDRINKSAWNRERDVSESQSGVSTLGTISETLLKIIFDSLVDNNNFFKVDKSEIQSYGDFVLMCLPNNLWLSVKSNFARERLLASGYTNDIIGVGFFQDPSEFTSLTRIRNFQRAGFLAMYCPDSPVTESQIKKDTTTYNEIINYFKHNSIDAPRNINGKEFIRPLGNLFNDLNALISEKDIRQRNTISF